MDKQTAEEIVKLIDEVVLAEYRAEAVLHPNDAYTQQRTGIQQATAIRIRTEIVVRAGLLPEGSTF